MPSHSHFSWNALPLTQLHALDPQADLGHAARVAHLSVRLAGLCVETVSCDALYQAACLHDLGKIKLHATAQLQRPLNQEERLMMNRHPVDGAEMAKRSLHISDQVSTWILHHHERFDGLGYPAGLLGKAIPVGARIIAIADVYDALVSDRPYRPAWCPSDAHSYILSEAGCHFDPELTSIFAALPV